MPHMLLVVLVAALAAQDSRVPPRDTSTPASGTARVSGRVTDRISGRPLVDIRVYAAPSAFLSPPDDLVLWTLTDAEGRYEIAGLPPGGYVFKATPGMFRGTHLPQVLGQSGPLEPSASTGAPSLHVAAGEVRTNVDLALSRAMVIEGRVLNEFGEPMSDIHVVAERWAYGKWREWSAGSRSDDQGMFRVFQLSPGDYRVCARPDAIRTTERTALEGRFSGTCHPAQFQLSTTDVAAVDIHLQRVGTFTLSGRVLNQAGTLALDATLSLVRTESGRLGMSSDGVVMRDGEFTIKGVLPGDYMVRAVAGMPTTAGQRRSMEQGDLPIRVVASDVPGLVVTTSRGASVRGRLRAEEGRLPESAVRRLLVEALPDRPGEAGGTVGSPLAARVEDDLTFELDHLFGPYVLQASNLPDGWYVKAVTQSGADITDRFAVFATSADPDALQIVLSNRGAHVTVRVRDAADTAVTAVAVLLIPTDPSRRRGPGVAAGRPRGDVIDLSVQRPGDYLVAAVSADDVKRLWLEAGLIDVVAKVAQPVSLRQDERRTLDLRLLPLPASR